MNTIKQAVETFKQYKQIKNAEQYVQGLRPLYENIYQALPKSNVTVDIGCAYGIMSLACAFRGDTVYALDMTDKFTNLQMFKDNNVSFHTYDIEHDKEVPFTSDLVILTEVLEHLNSNPLKSMQKIYASLNDGGYVVCSTPAKEIHGDTTHLNDKGKAGLWNDLDSWRKIPEYHGKWKDQHTFHYDQFDLVSLFTAAGFEIKDVYTIAEFSHLLIGRKR